MTLFFGICFISYFLKLSAGHGLRISNQSSFKECLYNLLTCELNNRELLKYLLLRNDYGWWLWIKLITRPCDMERLPVPSFPPLFLIRIPNSSEPLALDPRHVYCSCCALRDRNWYNTYLLSWLELILCFSLRRFRTHHILNDKQRFPANFPYFSQNIANVTVWL